MKAPSPPPTIPSRMRRMAVGSSVNTEHAADLPLVHAGTGEIVKGLFGHADQVALDELRALACTILGVLEAALPFQHGPGAVAVLRQFREHRSEIDLPIAERAKTASPVKPGLVTRIHSLPSVRIELRVLHVKGFDAR